MVYKFTQRGPLSLFCPLFLKELSKFDNEITTVFATP